MAGKPWYTNGIDEIQVGINDIIPTGYQPGRKPRTRQEKEISYEKRRETIRNKSEEEKQEIQRKRSASVSKAYQSKSDEEKANIIAKRQNTMQNKSNEWKQEYRQKLSQSTKGKNIGKEPWNKGLTKETDERVAKSSQSLSQYMKAYADEMKLKDPEFFNKWRANINDIMRKNNSFNRSIPEDNYFKDLVSIYGEDDVIRWYSDDRYPFACDFYIVSEDKFIELNKHWTHGGHPFDDTNLDDISKLEMWQDKGKTSTYYLNAIYVWTILDVKKQATAKENNLNYEAIY